MDAKLLAKISELSDEEKKILNGEKSVDKSLYSDGRDFIIDYSKFVAPGQLVEIRTHTRFVHFPKHAHNYVEMIYVCSGSIHQIINGNDIVLNAGNLLILSQGVQHEILPSTKGDVAVNFIILPDFFDRTLKMIGLEKNVVREFLIGCLNSSDSQISYLLFEVADVLPIQNLMENLIWSISYNAEDKHYINQYTFGVLFMHLIHRTETVRFDTQSYSHDLVLSALRYIDGHYRDCELGALAKSMKCDITWLSKQIKKMTGFTYLEILQQKRIDKAGILLTHSNLTIMDISLSVGYENFSYFHRLFKRYYGMSPGKYRKQFRVEGVTFLDEDELDEI